MTYCGQDTLVKHYSGAKTAVSLRCRAWTCPDCAPRRKRQLIAEAHHGRPTTFLTLTHRRVPGLTPAQAAPRLTRAWRLCRLRLMRKYRLKSLPFLAVLEKHVSGWPHMHLCLRSPWLSQKLISSIMQDLIDSPIVDIRKIDNAGRVGAYIAKYCGKCAQKFGKSKRYYSSRDWNVVIVRDVRLKGVWWQDAERSPVPINDYVASLVKGGWSARWPNAVRCELVAPGQPP